MPSLSHVDSPASGLALQLNRTAGWLCSFGLAALAALTVSLNAIIESFSTARMGAALVLVLLIHLARYPRFPLKRETLLYLCFLGYMLISLLWTDDKRLALNTLIPAGAFLMALIVFGALATLHDLRAVLAGTVFGLLAGAALYTRMSGFPFVYPANFSYNAIAGIYLIGLFTTLLLLCVVRARVSLLAIAAVFLLLVVATTSIKFNLGILLGVLAAALLSLRHFLALVKRSIGALALSVVALGFVVASNDSLMDVLQRGTDRIALGIEVLQALDNVPGYSAFEDRVRWQSDGLKGWARNPMFGYGVEAFRDRYGATSHSTPVDVLYNFGSIGFVLFYALAVSVLWRVRSAREDASQAVQAVVVGGLVCYMFVSLSAPLHYSAYFAMTVALSVRLLERRAGNPGQNDPAGVSVGQ